jgi:hypothetical protein
MANKFVPDYLSQPSRYSERSYNGGRVIVSFTSFPARIANVWQVVECIKRQTVRPSKIILWLSKEQFPNEDCLPKSLTNRLDDTFEIRFVEGNIKSHKKYYYSFREYPDDLVILIDDDIYYPTDMISKLLDAHDRFQQSVICLYGYKMRYDKEGKLMSYSDWKFIPKGYQGDNFFFGSGGGTLIQPRLLYKDVLNKDLSFGMTPMADDIWLNAMVKLSGLNLVKLPAGIICPILESNKVALKTQNLYSNQNDVQLKYVTDYYKKAIGKDPFEKS